MDSVEIEANGLTYTVKIASYTPGQRGTREDPPTGPEIELASRARMTCKCRGPFCTGTVPTTLRHVIAGVALARGWTLVRAERHIEEEALEAIAEAADDDDFRTSSNDDGYWRVD